jgi:para-aminobenzoate synthetase/4-amino-4-deoxychorismate lyase
LHADRIFALIDDGPGCAAGGALLFSDPLRVLACRAAHDLAHAFETIRAAAANGLWCVVLADYELGYLLEPKVLGRPYRSIEPLLTVLVFGRPNALDRAGVQAWLAARLEAVAEERRFCGVADVRPGIAEADYVEHVERIRRYIVAGDCYQVNLTYPLRFRHYGDPLALYRKLRDRQPVSHGAFVRLRERAILSLSPELFLQRRQGRLTSRPMKGTAARDADPVRDAASREWLAGSAKDRAENVMIVDLIRNDLGRLARTGSVRVERLFEIEPYPTVWQMTSTVTADAPQADIEQVLRALFPCGSVTGAPKIRAMQIIAELEKGPRGLYTGAIGCVAPDGDFGFNVAIRTLVLGDDGGGRMGIGSGIVYDSMPAAEWAECQWKARFLTGAEAGFELIETMLWSADAGGIALLDLHMQRLGESARCFGFRFDELAIRAAVAARTAGLPQPPHRVRLLLAQDGGLRIDAEPLPPVGPLRVCLSPHRVDSADLFLYHKTTHRALYDAELRRAVAQEGCFDALFCNERGELTEGARSNIFLAFGGELHTPPVFAGLLNGVMRRNLLARGEPRIVERTLYPEDLRRADAVYLSNALRGLLRVDRA